MRGGDVTVGSIETKGEMGFAASGAWNTENQKRDYRQCTVLKVYYEVRFSSLTL